MTDAYAPEPAPARVEDAATTGLTRLVGLLAEEAMFALSGAGSGGGGASPKDALEGVMKRRTDVHAALAAGQADPPRMTGAFDAWLVELTRVMAPVAPPSWLPMSDVLREKVTLEGGTRGLRSIFSSKPSDKETQRVKRLGTLAVRVLRAVYAADGPLDAEDARSIAALIGALGLPDADAKTLAMEPPVSVDQLDVFGELEPAVARGLVRGAWLAAAVDAIDPREEQVVRVLAEKLGLAADVESMRNDANARVEAKRVAGYAAVDAIRFVLADRPERTPLAAHAGTLMIPRRFREEALAQIAHGTPVTLSKRHAGMPQEDRVAVLGVAWAAALHDDPSLARRALLRARLDRFAVDIGEEGGRVRTLVDAAIDEVLAIVASGMR